MSLGNKTWPLIAITSMAMAGYAFFYNYSNPKTRVVETEKIVTKEVYPEISLEMYSPQNHQRLTLKEDEQIKFIWNKLDKATVYQLTVQNEHNEVANFEIKENMLDIKVVKGSHFRWSLKSISAKLGIKSAQGEFFVDRAAVLPEVERVPASLPTPVEEVSFNIAEKKVLLNYPEDSIQLSWKGNQEGRYRFVITRVMDKKIVVDDEVKGTARPIHFTNPGVYEVSLFDLGQSPSAIADSLVITYKKKIAAFHPTQPFDVSGNGLQVNYNIYEGESARLRAFYKKDNKEIGTFKVKGHAHRFVLKEKGEYCFELLNDDSPKKLASSGPMCLNLEGGRGRSVASVEDKRPASIGKKILNYYKINGVDTYQFDLPEVKGATNYQIRLFSDSKGQNLLREVTLKDRRVFWKTQRELKTYIQYRALNQSQEIAPWSETGELIFPISPLEIN